MNRTIIAKNKAIGAKRNGGTIAGLHEVNLLDDGALAFFNDKDGTLIVDQATADANLADKNAQTMIVACGAVNQSEGAFVSIPITLNGATVEYSNYIVPKKQRTYIGDDGISGSFNFPATLNTGDVVFVKFTDVTVRTDYEGDKHRYYEYSIQDGDTNVIIADALRTKINADPNRNVDITNVGASTGWRIDAINFFFQFEVFMGINGAATAAYVSQMTPDINYTTGNAIPYDSGLGSPTEVAEMERLSRIQSGQHNRVHLTDFYNKRATQVETNKTYDIVVIQYERWKSSGYKTELASTQYLNIAIDSAAAATIADLKEVLTSAFGTTF